jgi:hypothetical protein
MGKFGQTCLSPSFASLASLAVKLFFLGSFLQLPFFAFPLRLCAFAVKKEFFQESGT